MHRNKTLFLQCYDLLQNVLLDAFNVQTIYFTPPYKDIDKIDFGIRATVWTNYNDNNSKFHFAKLSSEYRILIVKSNLGFYNLMIFMGPDSNADFIAIGPFRNDKLSANYFAQILKEASISPSIIQGIKYIYESMPFIQLDTIINVTRHILHTFIPEFEAVTPELIQYSEQKRAVEVDAGVLEQNFFKSSEEYYDRLSVFLKYLTAGDNTNSKKALQLFLKTTRMTLNQNMRDYKILLQMVNNYCQLALLQTSIHPSHILKQAFSLGIKIENITSPNQLEQIPNEICRKYTLLVTNYASQKYSILIRDVIAYIEFHLEEDLSLSQLAAHFDKNATVLSNTFSKETGQTLTGFIRQARIREAIRLFNTTNLSVSEVAMSIGYQDFSYFSKLFSKTIGCSPSEYRRKKDVP